MANPRRGGGAAAAARRPRGRGLLLLLAAAGLSSAAAALAPAQPSPASSSSALLLGTTATAAADDRAALDRVWRDDAPPAAEYDTGARRALAALLGMDGASEEAAVAAASSTTTSRRRRRALLGVEVEQGMAPLSRYSATMQDIVAPKGYPLEEHKVTTDDGFILTMHRIPAGKYRHTELPFGTLPETREAAAAAAGGDQPLPPPTKKPAVLLHHGITLSSASFAVLNANESLAYVLADAGFDVWMANSRGNTFSWAHTSDEEGGAARSATSATPKKEALRDPRYWQRTSMDDIALRDLPAQIDRVLQVTQTKRLGYVGHSQGCTLLLALLATKPEYNAKVTAAAQMGPVTYVKELQAPFLKGGIENKVDQLLKRLAWSDPMPTRVTAPVLAGACRRWPVGGSCAKGMAYSFYGPSVHMTPDDYVEIGSVWPAGVASRNLEHWAQMMRREGEPRLTRYDFGTNCTQRALALQGRAHPMYESCNQAEYDGLESPPEYDLSKVTVPMALFEGALDVLATAADVGRLKKALPASGVVFEKLYPTYNHVDFVFARNAVHKADLVEVLLRYAPMSYV